MKTAVQTLLALCMFLVAGAMAQAQPITNPPFSPYQNLYRPGAPPYLNYLQFVSPELSFRSSIGGLQQQTSANQQNIANLQNYGPPVTGHLSGFQTQRAYFMTYSGGPIGTSGFGGTGAGGVGGFGTVGGGAGGRTSGGSGIR